MICPVNPSHLQVTTTPQLATVSLQARLAPRSEKLHGAANYHVFRLYTVYVHYVHYMFIICSLYVHCVLVLSFVASRQLLVNMSGSDMIRWSDKERSALSSQMRFHSVFVTLCWKCSLAGGNIHHSLVSTKSGDASLSGDAPVQVSTWSASYLWQVGSAFCAVNNTDPYRTGWDSAFPSLDAVGSIGWSTWINSQSSWILVSSSQVPWFPAQPTFEIGGWGFLSSFYCHGD
jgi:hypothetical protein